MKTKNPCCRPYKAARKKVQKKQDIHVFLLL
jgi:hypothetical protein